MSILQGNAKQRSVRSFYPKTIEGSLRFNDDDSAYLSWTPASAGNRKTWTWSGWVKRGNLGTGQRIFHASTDSNNRTEFYFRSDDQIEFFSAVGGVHRANIKTDAKFRDPSAWYHLVVKFDAANTSLVIYINGVSQTLTTTTAVVNTDQMVNATNVHTLGRYNPATSSYLDAYLAEVHFTDGTAYDADAFGEFKNGVWVAKTPDVTYGTNGFYLNFQDDAEVESFNTVLWRGNGATQSITGMGFQPDLVWIKERNTATNHHLYDVIRGATYFLHSNATSAEQSGYPTLTAFESDGFEVGSDGSVNGSGDSYVAWGWKAGDSNVSNTDGSITSTVRANDTYGFSIVSYTGTGSAATVGHGLSTAPSMVITKNRDASGQWVTQHTSLSGGTYWLLLNSTSGETNDSSVVPAAPTTSVFSIGTDGNINTSSNAYIAYCWAEKSGYSKFGSYEGNASTSGPSVTCGFKPSMVIIKGIDSTPSWYILDSTRDTDGKIGKELYPNLSNAEGDNTAGDITFSDTGFQITASGSGLNALNETFIYAAFADTREAAFWLDQSGNDNDWQPVNLDHNDTVADSPTNNFATLNPLFVGPSVSLKDGNLVLDDSSGFNESAIATMQMPSGQWYWEVTPLTIAATRYVRVGVTKDSIVMTDPVGSGSEGYSYQSNDGTKWNNNSGSSYGATWNVGDTIGTAFDADAGTLEFYKNGVSQGVAFTGLTGGEYFPSISCRSSVMAINFGQQPFKYDPPA